MTGRALTATTIQNHTQAVGNIQKQKGVSNCFLSVVHTVPTYGSSRGPRARLCNNFYDAAGSHQLQVLYLCYLVLRVCLRKFKGSALKDDMWFIFEWEKVELPADLAKEMLIVLKYHNVFFDMYHVRKGKYSPDEIPPPWKLWNACLAKGVRLHDVRKVSGCMMGCMLFSRRSTLVPSTQGADSQVSAKLCQTESAEDVLHAALSDLGMCMYFNTDLKLHKNHKEYICTGDGTGLVHWHSAIKHSD